MCGSMADIQSAAAEIRRGKKEEERRRRTTNHSMKIYMVSLLHRATIKNAITQTHATLTICNLNICRQFCSYRVRVIAFYRLFLRVLIVGINVVM